MIIPLSKDYKIPLLNQERSANHIDEEGCLIPEIPIPKNIAYKFLHDRVQQAAYSLIPEEDKEAVHLQVGRLLLKNTEEHDLKENLFDIVNQLNEGCQLITNQTEKCELAKLNLKAGQKAKMSTAYEPALRYLQVGLGLLEPKSWNYQYEFTLEIHIETLEVLSLTTQFTQVDSLSETILNHSKNILERVPVYQILILSKHAQFKQHEAIDIALNFVEELGTNIPRQPERVEESIDNLQQSIHSFLKGKNISDLSNLPLMTDPYKQGSILILQHIISSILQFNFSIFILIVLNQLNLCIRYGNPPQASSVYSFYGMILCGVMKDFNLGYEFGALSLKLQDKFKYPKLEALVVHLNYGFIWHWKQSIRNITIDNTLLNGLQKGIDIGDHEYASYTVITHCLIQFFRGDALEKVTHNSTKYTNLVNKFRQEYPYLYMKICSNSIVNLIDGYPERYCFVIGDNQKEEDRYLTSWRQDKNEWLLFITYFFKTIICYLFNDRNRAYDNAANAEQYVQSSGAYLPAPQYIFLLLPCFNISL